MKSYQPQIKSTIVTFLREKQQKFSQYPTDSKVFADLLSLATAGKMLRGSLLINTYQLLALDSDHQQEIEAQVLRSAAALELAQTAFLIHDDIIDQDHWRRGQATLHSQYQQEISQSNQSGVKTKQVAENLALCVGDLTFFLSFELLPTHLTELFSQQLSLTALGEMNDIRLAFSTINKIEKKQILQMYQNKTSSYSTCLPLMAAGLLAKTDQVLIDLLEEIGQTLGLIFQIKDDHLGLFSSKEKLGKPIGADIKEGKTTLHFWYLFNAVNKRENQTEQQLIANSFGNSHLTKSNFEKVLKLFERYRIADQIEADLEKLSATVKTKIKQLENSDLQELLNNFLKINLERNR